MSAYLGTDAVRTFIVPATPPPDIAVAANFERFDGLTPAADAYSPGPWDNPAAGVPFGVDYAPTPRPGQLNTPVNAQVYTPGPIGGTVGTVGGQPLPVHQWNYQGRGDYTRAGTRTIGGPKMGRQMYQGAAETVFFSELQSNPPQPGELAAIIAGLA